MNTGGAANIPVPDPSERSSDEVKREVAHLRALIEARLLQMDEALVQARVSGEKALEAARITSATAVDAALAASKTAIVELDGSIARRVQSVSELTDAKFVTYRTLLDSQAEKVALALAASDKAVAKAEGFNETRFLLISNQIEELKASSGATASATAGGKAVWGYVAALAGLAVAVLSVVVAVVVALGG